MPYAENLDSTLADDLGRLLNLVATPASPRLPARPEAMFRPWLRELHALASERFGACHYVYVLCEPSRSPIYVGYSSVTARPFAHRRLSMSCNESLIARIQEIEHAGGEVLYDLDFVAPTKEQALHREEFLVAHYGRLDISPSGILHNLREGGRAPRAYSTATIGRWRRKVQGPFLSTWHDWFRDVPGIKMASIPLDVTKRPKRCFPRWGTAVTPKPIQNTRVPRLFAALALSARENKITLHARCRIPRRLEINETVAYLGKGVCNDILEQSGVRLQDAVRPEDQAFELSARFIARMIDILGSRLLREMGILPSIWRLHRHWGDEA